MKAVLLLVLGCSALAATDRPDLSGTWKPESGGDTSWIITQEPDKIHIRRLDASGKASMDVACGTKGLDCPLKIDGDNVKVTYYYNGPTLVELLWKGKQVTKTRRTLSSDGTKLVVEIMSMNPPGAATTVTLVKASETAKR